MKSYLQHLENNEAILLMYLANELPDQDRAEVEEMLASDAKLRTELEHLRQTQELAFDVLESLDGATRAPVPTIMAQNQVSDLIHEWADARRQPKEMVSNSRRSLPWWRASFATAAMLLIGSYIWAVYHPAPSVQPSQTDRILTDDDKLALLSNSFAQSTPEESSSEESNLHVAEALSESEVATAIRVDADDSADSSSGKAGSDSNATGTP